MSRRIRIQPILALISALLWMACQAEEMSSGDISAEAFLAAPPANALVLDVRSQEEFQEGHVPGAINVPHDELASRLSELSGGTQRPVVVYCERGGRAGMAAEAAKIMRGAVILFIVVRCMFQGFVEG